MKKILIATKNLGKIEEIKAILSDLNIQILSLIDLNYTETVVEDGITFVDNALKKARSVYQQFKMPVLSDDSGLEVDELNSQPGVLSARFAGEDKNCKANNEKLLTLLRNIHDPNRKAKFKCVAVFKTELSEIIEEGICTGRIIHELRGTHGFGYDPLFVPDGYDLTFAQMSLDIKNKISHRGKAFQNIKQHIINYFNKTCI